MQRADLKAVMHTTQCPYFKQLLGSERNTCLSVLLFSYLEGIFLYFCSTKAFFFPRVCWSCLLPLKVLNLVLPCGFQDLSFNSHLQTPGKPDGVTWIRPGGPCIWKDLCWGPCIWKDLCWVPCWVVSMCMRTSPGRATRKGEANQHPLVKSKDLY